MKRNLILMSALFAGSIIVNDGFGCMESLRRFCLNRTTDNNDFSWVDDDNESFSISDDYFETESEEIDETENSPKKELNDKIKKEFLAELKTAEGLEDVVSICNSFKNQINKYKNLYSSDTIDSLNKFLNKKIYNTVKEILRSDPADVVNQHVQYIWDTINWLNKNDKNTVIKNSEAYNDCLYYCRKYLRDCTELYSLGLRNYNLPLLKESFLKAENYFYQIIKEDNDDRAISRILDNELSGFISKVSVAKTREEVDQITEKFNEAAEKYSSYKDIVNKFTDEFIRAKEENTRYLNDLNAELSKFVEDVAVAETPEKIDHITKNFEQAAEKYSSFKDIVDAATEDFETASSERTNALNDIVDNELSKFVFGVSVAKTYGEIDQITEKFNEAAEKYSSFKDIVNAVTNDFNDAKELSINALTISTDELAKFVENVKTARTLEKIEQITKDFEQAAEKYSFSYKDLVKEFREDFEAAKKEKVEFVSGLENLNNELSKFVEDVESAETLEEIAQITKDFYQVAEEDPVYRHFIQTIIKDFEAEKKVSVAVINDLKNLNNELSKFVEDVKAVKTLKEIDQITEEFEQAAEKYSLYKDDVQEFRKDFNQAKKNSISRITSTSRTKSTFKTIGRIGGEIALLTGATYFLLQQPEVLPLITATSVAMLTNVNSTNVVVPSLVTQEPGTRLFPQYNSNALIPYGKIGYEMPSDICIPQNSTAFTELTTSYEEAGNEILNDIPTMDYSYVMAFNWAENHIYSDMLKKQKKSKALVVYNHQ